MSQSESETYPISTSPMSIFHLNQNINYIVLSIYNSFRQWVKSSWTLLMSGHIRLDTLVVWTYYISINELKRIMMANSQTPYPYRTIYSYDTTNSPLSDDGLQSAWGYFCVERPFYSPLPNQANKAASLSKMNHCRDPTFWYERTLSEGEIDTEVARSVKWLTKDQLLTIFALSHHLSYDVVDT